MSTDQLLREPYGRAHCLVEIRKIITADGYLQAGVLASGEYPVVTTVNFDSRLNEMDAGCSESRHPDRHHYKERLKV